MTTPLPFPTLVRTFLFGLMLLLGAMSVSGQSATPRVAVIDIDGTITPPMASYVERGIRKAERDGVDAVVLRIDTPGGLSTAMDDIVTSILESDVPVIAWVGPGNARAASAGVYITYACHVAAMAPGTNIGSASPVQMGGDDIDETMANKVTNDAVARITNLAELRGRNVEWAVAAVRDADNITANRALELGVIEYVSPSISELLNEIDGTEVTLANGDRVTLQTAGATTSNIGMNGFETFLQMISDPTIAYLLLSFGSLGIFLELSNPGTFVPGIIGVVSFILGFYALGTLPVNWTGVALIALAFALFFIDLFVSSFGLLLVGAMTSFILGSYMLIDDSVPGYAGVSRPVIWTAAALVLASALIIGVLVVRLQRSQARTGKKSMVGQLAKVRSALDPDGMVYFDGELWRATLADDTAHAPVGSTVRILEIHGLRMTVALTEPAETNPIARTSRQEQIVPVS